MMGCLPSDAQPMHRCFWSVEFDRTAMRWRATRCLALARARLRSNSDRRPRFRLTWRSRAKPSRSARRRVSRDPAPGNLNRPRALDLADSAVDPLILIGLARFPRVGRQLAASVRGIPGPDRVGLTRVPSLASRGPRRLGGARRRARSSPRDSATGRARRSSTSASRFDASARACVRPRMPAHAARDTANTSGQIVNRPARATSCGAAAPRASPYRARQFDQRRQPLLGTSRHGRPQQHVVELVERRSRRSAHLRPVELRSRREEELCRPSTWRPPCELMRTVCPCFSRRGARIVPRPRRVGVHATAAHSAGAMRSEHTPAAARRRQRGPIS